MLCGNSHYFVVSYLAAVGLGAVAVPLNPASPGPELERELAVVEPKAVVVGPSASTSWRTSIVPTVPSVAHVIICEGEANHGDHSLDAPARRRAGADRRRRPRTRSPC